MKEKRILLIEDNPDHEALTLRALRKHEIAGTITVARDGAKAIEELFGADGQGADTLPTVVLLDLKLPKIDGLAVLQRIRQDERTRYLPVVVLTSSDEEEDVVKSYEFGANSYVRKPVNFDQFVEAARQLGVYWLVLNEAAI